LVWGEKEEEMTKLKVKVKEASDLELAVLPVKSLAQKLGSQGMMRLSQTPPEYPRSQSQVKFPGVRVRRAEKP